MNIKRFDNFKNESTHLNESNINEDELMFNIQDIMHSNIYLRDVPYSMEEGAQEVDPDSTKDAALSIIKMLKEKGII